MDHNWLKTQKKQQKKCFEGIKETKKRQKKKRIIPRHKISGQVGKQKNIYTHTPIQHHLHNYIKCYCSHGLSLDWTTLP